jgi:hypothetical protein
MSSNHAEISKKINELLKQTKCDSDCDIRGCLTCFIKKYECPCGEIATTKKCGYCTKRVCDECEYVENSYSVCGDCFKVYY